MRRIFHSVKGPLDLVLSIVVIPCAYLLLAFRKAGASNLPRTRERLKAIGVFPIRDHYYEPLFKTARLRNDLSVPRTLPGVDFRDAAQLEFLSGLEFGDELAAVIAKPGDEPGSRQVELGNAAFESGDAEFLYQFVRRTRPSKVIEIGCGVSTKIIRAALEANETDGVLCEQVCVEPYEQPWLEEFPGIQLRRALVEEIDLNWADELGPSDLLFIDSSHMIRPQGDVTYEYLEVLPRLRPGVNVHIHDIFSPRDYPQSWIKEDVRFWNEQYLLEAMLSGPSRYEIVAALNYLKHEHFEALSRVCPFLNESREPGSIYIRVT